MISMNNVHNSKTLNCEDGFPMIITRAIHVYRTPSQPKKLPSRQMTRIMPEKRTTQTINKSIIVQKKEIKVNPIPKPIIRSQTKKINSRRRPIKSIEEPKLPVRSFKINYGNKI